MIGSSVIYVAEFTSGQIVAYGLPLATVAVAKSRTVQGRVRATSMGSSSAPPRSATDRALGRWAFDLLAAVSRRFLAARTSLALTEPYRYDSDPCLGASGSLAPSELRKESIACSSPAGSGLAVRIDRRSGRGRECGAAAGRRSRSMPRPRTARTISPSPPGRSGDDIEAVYMLDYLTGDLKAAVLNVQTGKFMSFYEHNIAQGPADSAHARNPRYMMVTGEADMRRGSQGQIGSSVVYVAEFASGQIDGLRLALDGRSRASPGAVPRAVHSAGRHPLSRAGDSQLSCAAGADATPACRPPAPRFYNARSGCEPGGFTAFLPLFPAGWRGVQITVNGNEREVAGGTSIAALLAELELPPPQVAVEVNLELIPRGRHAEHRLADGDRLEVVTLVGGG